MSRGGRTPRRRKTPRRWTAGRVQAGHRSDAAGRSGRAPQAAAHRQTDLRSAAGRAQCGGGDLPDGAGLHRYPPSPDPHRSGPRTAFIPQTHLPGAEAEVDFADVTIRPTGEQVKVFLFALRLSYSARRCTASSPRAGRRRSSKATSTLSACWVECRPARCAMTTCGPSTSKPTPASIQPSSTPSPPASESRRACRCA
jgi:hypothetical protein